MYNDKNATRPGMVPPKQNKPWKNMGKLIFLLAALIAAWLVLEWWMGK